MSLVKHAVIAAAGLGSRLGHGKPKCLVEIDGVTVLSHQLSLLADVEDVRVVVGFEEKAVIDEVKRNRRDVIIVRNPGFRSTTTLHSYALGAQYLSGDCLFLDGDLLLVPESFAAFLATCEAGVPKLGLTPSQTVDAVYAVLEKGNVVDFSRSVETEYEWSNVSWLPVRFLHEIGNTAVYEHLKNYLPISTGDVISFEIDTETDLLRARQNAHKFALGHGASLNR